MTCTTSVIEIVPASDLHRWNGWQVLNESPPFTRLTWPDDGPPVYPRFVSLGPPIVSAEPRADRQHDGAVMRAIRGFKRSFAEEQRRSLAAGATGFAGPDTSRLGHQLDVASRGARRRDKTKSWAWGEQEIFVNDDPRLYGKFKGTSDARTQSEALFATLTDDERAILMLDDGLRLREKAARLGMSEAQFRDAQERLNGKILNQALHGAALELDPALELRHDAGDAELVRLVSAATSPAAARRFSVVLLDDIEMPPAPAVELPRTFRGTVAF